MAYNTCARLAGTQFCIAMGTCNMANGKENYKQEHLQAYLSYCQLHYNVDFYTSIAGRDIMKLFESAELKDVNKS